VAKWGVIEEELGPWVERHGWDPGPDAYARLAILMELWTRYGAVMNLHGARTRAELVRHVQDGLETGLCARRAIEIDAATRWLDVGSGGGFPALVVAATLPCGVTATEPRQKRASFLELALGAVELKSSRVIRARIDASTWNENAAAGVDMAHREPFRVVSSRAVFTPAVWLELGKALVARPGIVVVHGAVAEQPRVEIAGTFGPIAAHCFT
jgi:16S rRNA (guanine527-N7)-methyltransferase